MPRNPAGIYTLPGTNPVTTGTTITSNWANGTMADIASELTASLPRDGSAAMTDSLQLPDGTSSAPALTFSAETNSGLYRAGTNDLRLQINAANVLQATGTTITIPIGLTVTQDAVGGSAVTGTGNGAGYGGDFNAGSGNGSGVRGAGAGTGAGVTGVGGPTGTGVLGTGGATSGAGVTGTGGAAAGIGVVGLGTGAAAGVSGTGATTGAGVNGTGGPSDGTGGTFTGGATNGAGLKAFGTAAGNGAEGYGGGTSGLGVYGQGGAPNGVGVYGQGTGNGAGGKFLNVTGSTAGGVEGWSSSATSAGAYCTNSAGGRALQVHTGHAYFSGSNPARTDAAFNILTPMNLVKSWGLVFSSGAGAYTIEDGFNFAGVTPTSSTQFSVAFQTPLVWDKFAVILTQESTGAIVATDLTVTSRATGGFTIKQVISGSSTWIHFVVFGMQT